MVADIDIYRTAAIVVKEHGENAPIPAAMRADELMEGGDMAKSSWRSYVLDFP